MAHKATFKTKQHYLLFPNPSELETDDSIFPKLIDSFNLVVKLDRRFCKANSCCLLLFFKGRGSTVMNTTLNAQCWHFERCPFNSTWIESEVKRCCCRRSVSLIVLLIVIVISTVNCDSIADVYFCPGYEVTSWQWPRTNYQGYQYHINLHEHYKYNWHSDSMHQVSKRDFPHFSAFYLTK